MKKKKEPEIIQDTEMEEAVRRAFNLDKGKVVMVECGEYIFRSDYKCADKGSDVCELCRLRFICYLNQYLIITAEQLDLNRQSLDHTINELVEAFVEDHKEKKTAARNFPASRTP